MTEQITIPRSETGAGGQKNERRNPVSKKTLIEELKERRAISNESAWGSERHKHRVELFDEIIPLAWEYEQITKNSACWNEAWEKDIYMNGGAVTHETTLGLTGKEHLFSIIEDHILDGEDGEELIDWPAVRKEWEAEQKK